MNLRRLAMATAVGMTAIATLTLLWLLSGPNTPVTAGPAPSAAEVSAVEELLESPLHDATPIHYVATTGTDGGDCSTPGGACLTIQYAVDHAGEGDEIRIASGIYPDVNARPRNDIMITGVVTQVVYISKTVIIRGGYTTTNGFADPPDPVANPTTLHAQGQGRVLYITGDISPKIEGLRMTGGNATGFGGDTIGKDAGGGVYIITATAHISNNQVFGNTSRQRGGGFYLCRSDATLSGNVISANTANESGGGLYLVYSDAELIDNVITSNEAKAYSGGGLCMWSSAPVLRGNSFTDNDADNTGGGLYMDYYCDATLINNVFADNQANIAGSALHILRSSPRLLHTTIARNSGGDGSGVYVGNLGWPYSTVAMTNTILVGHTVGITVAQGVTVTLEATLWHANTTDWSGNAICAKDRRGNPAFDTDGYHLTAGSAAIDEGLDAGVTADIDGESRPVGTGYDIGADEFPVVWHPVYLPLVMKRWPPIPNTPVLNPIDNTDQDNYYTVTWQEADLATTYILEEATNASFSGAQVVYQGANLSWAVPSPGRTPDTYYYRVKARNSWADSSWSNAQQTVIYPLFVGLQLRWDGDGYIRGSDYYNIGYHLTRDLNDLTDADTIRSHNHSWYSPNPLDFDSETWDSYYSISTGYFRSSSAPSDPSWKWGCPWILPYDWQFTNGQTFSIDGQAFTVSGPHSGYTAFGQAVQYWQLVNRDKFLYWDGGGDWKQYIHSGDITLRYDAGNTRLRLRRDVLRRYYYKGQRTNDTVQYIDNLTSANVFPSLGLVTEHPEYFSTPLPQSNPAADETSTSIRDSLRTLGPMLFR